MEKQGSLDSLCCLYSLINSFKALIGPSKFDSQAMFNTLIKKLDQHQSLASVTRSGTELHVFKTILIPTAIRHAAQKYKKKFKITPAFSATADASLEEYWNKLSLHMIKHGPGSVILHIHGNMHHCTTVAKVTPRTMQLYDTKPDRLMRRRCTVRLTNAARPSLLLPDRAWLVSLEK